MVGILSQACGTVLYNPMTGAVAYYNAYFGRGTGPILLDDLLCTGREARLIDCPRYSSQGIGTFDNCPNGHGEDAGVKCPARKYLLKELMFALVTIIIRPMI